MLMYLFVYLLFGDVTDWSMYSIGRGVLLLRVIYKYIVTMHI